MVVRIFYPNADYIERSIYYIGGFIDSELRAGRERKFSYPTDKGLQEFPNAKPMEMRSCLTNLLEEKTQKD